MERPALAHLLASLAESFADPRALSQFSY